MIARNNIFNIRATRGGQWKGQIGTNKGFAEFETQEYGIRAWLVLMRTYRRKYRCRTIRSIVTRFAPPSENSTEQYIRHCAKYVTKNDYVVLDSSLDYARLGVAMARMETNTTLTTQDILNVMLKYGIHII